MEEALRMTNRTALGRGLEALIPEAPMTSGERGEVAVELIDANPEQPRSHFDERGLAELSSSLKRHGVLQPILVTALPDGRYRLVAGERRLRAARMAGLEMMPAVVRDVDENTGLELALVENLQREDLDPMDEARAFEALMEVGNLAQGDVAERVGKDRSTVANALRLLDLPLEIQEMISEGTLSAGHGRAILTLSTGEERRGLAERVVQRGLSVRETEVLARGPRPRRRTVRARRTADPVLKDYEERLQRALGTNVRVERIGHEGSIRIEYYSGEELERLIELLLSIERRGET
jgi:ParB family chromosome partitioning protein